MFAKAKAAPTDVHLHALASAGDHRAFNALILAHQSAVRHQLRRLTKGDAALADDLAQETFMQAWAHLDTFRGAARMASWLYQIAYNQFLMHVRSHRAMQPLADEEPGADPSWHRDVERDVNWAIGQLPEPERVALIHCYQLDLSHEEAAQVLDVPLGTLKSHVLRGKMRLRTLLAAWAKEIT